MPYHPQRLAHRHNVSKRSDGRRARTVCETVLLLVHSLSAEPLNTLTRCRWDQWITSHPPRKFAFPCPFLYTFSSHGVVFFPAGGLSSVRPSLCPPVPPRRNQARLGREEVAMRSMPNGCRRKNERQISVDHCVYGATFWADVQRFIRKKTRPTIRL